MDPAIAVCSTNGNLAAIKDAAVQLAILERSLPAHLGAWLDALKPAQLPQFRVLVRLDECRQAIAPLMASGMPAASPMTDALADDVQSLVALFARLAGCDTVDIRLERIVGNACWKFHRDHVPVRLLTTYRGPGSQWVAPAEADRALRDQERYNGPLHRLPRHAIGLFKGCADDGCTGIVHRSPPIAGTGSTRLLLCLNVPTSASPPRWSG